MRPHPRHLYRAIPKVIENGHIEPIHLAPLRPLFPRWYNARTQYDYHDGNPGHSTKNCTAFRHKIQDLINLGKLKFEESNEPARVEDLFGAKTEMTRQEEKTPREIGSQKTAI